MYFVVPSSPSRLSLEDKIDDVLLILHNLSWRIENRFERTLMTFSNKNHLNYFFNQWLNFLFSRLAIKQMKVSYVNGTPVVLPDIVTENIINDTSLGVTYQVLSIIWELEWQCRLKIWLETIWPDGHINVLLMAETHFRVTFLWSAFSVRVCFFAFKRIKYL